MHIRSNTIFVRAISLRWEQLLKQNSNKRKIQNSNTIIEYRIPINNITSDCKITFFTVTNDFCVCTLSRDKIAT